MITYIAQSFSNSYQDIVLYKYINGNLASKTPTTTSDLKNIIDEDSDLIYLIPSSLVSSYVNDVGTDKNSEAAFLSDKEDNIVDDISNVAIKISDKFGYLINKSLIDDINNDLSAVRSKTYVYPDYLLFRSEGDSIFFNEENAIFHYADGTGTSLNKNYVDQYIELIKTEREFNPKLYTSDANAGNDLEYVELSKLHDDLINSHQEFDTLFKFKYSISSILNKSSLSKLQISVMAICLISLISLPPLILGSIKNNTNTYKAETAKLFNSISNNITRVIEPRSQIDSLLGEKFNSKNEIEIPNIDFIYRLGGVYVNKIDIDFKINTATVQIQEMPKMQLSLITSMGDTFGIKVIDQNLQESSSGASGTIVISFPNE
jgi:hypothetical protein